MSKRFWNFPFWPTSLRARSYTESIIFKDGSRHPRETQRSTNALHLNTETEIDMKV